MSTKRALITGITGQDGSYLAELLLAKGYEVHGIMRRASSPSTARIDHIFDRLHLRYGDMTDSASVGRLVATVWPDEVYNLAAQSHVGVSFEIPEYTGQTVGIGTCTLLEALRLEASAARVYQASSSEMFGSTPPPQAEHSKFQPRSPYACAKVYAYQLAQLYRQAYRMHVSNGILFNHESPRRGVNFVTAKVCRAAAKRAPVVLGNLEAKRDWGFAGDYVEAMWLMLQQPKPDDYVIATGESHSVSELCQVAYAHVGLDWRDYVTTDAKYKRPAEVDHLRGDASKAKRQLGWEPKTKFEDLVRMMVDAFV